MRVPAIVACVAAFNSAVLTGCSLFGPDEVPVRLEILGVLELEPGNEKAYYGPPSINVQGGTSVAVVTGDFLLPCVNYRIREHAEREGDLLTLRLGIRSDRICATIEVKYAYRATLYRLTPGHYTIRVIHELYVSSQGGVGLTEVYRGTVQVR